VSKLNSGASPSITYKVLFLGRHGEGSHNVAEHFYGTKAWDCYWSLQPGNATSSWSDALLTPVGEAQALKANAFWRLLISQQKIPCPEVYYASPLSRCLATANLTFSGLDLPEDRPFIPLIKEKFRETNGVHTCDRRSSKTIIHTHYPNWPIEDGFSEEDELWDPVLRESDLAQDQRAKEVFDDVFEKEERTWISVSSHSGQIAAALRGESCW
jgi:broad specificity phosphatase PhoE